MKQYIPLLKRTKLFAGVGDDEIASMLTCLDARLHTYSKGTYVLREGEHISNITILVHGNLYIQKDDYWGNRSILGHIAVGEMFGEAYVAPESGALPHDVVAVEDSAIISMSKRSTREKLLSYLSEEAKREGCASFTIPFNRQQLADFLSVDRSAMSNELGKMRDDGLLRFEKNRFELL